MGPQPRGHHAPPIIRRRTRRRQGAPDEVPATPEVERGEPALGNQSLQRQLRSGAAPTHFLVAHQETLGNQALQRGLPASTGEPGPSVARSPAASLVQRAPGPLTPTQESSAITFHNTRYDLRSTMIIQHASSTVATGTFNDVSAQAVATFQGANGLLVDGKVGDQTINSLVTQLAAAGSHQEAIQLVLDLYNIDSERNTLSISHDPALATDGNTTFESGNLRVITLGATAFTSATKLRTTIRAELARRAPAQAAVGPRPDTLTPEQEQAAIARNKEIFTDRRSALAIQGLVGTGFDGIFGPDTIERIAALQAANAIVGAEGIVNEATMRIMVAQLDAAGHQNSAIRLIIDFFDLDTHGALLDIAFDPTVTSNAETGGENPGPSTVRVGPAAFAQSFAGLVHTIAHELEHVRQRREGLQPQSLREFLGEAIEIMSVNMPEEDAAGLMDDAGRAIFHWNKLTAAIQGANFARFEEVREKLRARFADFTPDEQTTHQPLMDQYNAVVHP